MHITFLINQSSSQNKAPLYLSKHIASHPTSFNNRLYSIGTKWRGETISGIFGTALERKMEFLKSLGENMTSGYQLMYLCTRDFS